MHPALLVMGTAGSGKTTLARGLAERLGGSFIEGDDLHSTAAQAKMAAGTPLTDADRWPWLDAIAAALAKARRTGPAIAACSALRRSYRDRLRATLPDLITIYPEAGRRLIETRLAARRGHFFPPALLASQFAILEPPGEGEACITVPADQPSDVLIAEALARFTAQPPSSG